jgi:hypothetical protein
MSEHWIDRAWKDVIKENPDDVVSFFMPELAAERDYSQKPSFADPARPSIGGKSDKGGNISDICMALPLITGDVPRALFVVEQQHEEDKTLPLRVFQSWYRASDEYAIPVTSLAIYTGRAKPINAYTWAWRGTSVNFAFNVYSVAEEEEEKLKMDKRPFALPLLAARKMLDAGGNPAKRGEYSLELLDMIKERGLGDLKAWSFQKFTSYILQIDKKDIDPKVREVWKVQFRPMDEVVKEIYIRDAKEEGMEEKAFEVARNLLKMGLPVEQIAMGTGLSVEEVSDLPL